MKVALTGATGFVGSSLARALAAEGHAIVALARPSANRDRLAGLDVTWRTGDVTEPESLHGLFSGVDWVVHAAGMLGRAGVAESAYRRLHVDGTRHVLAEVAAVPKPPRVLYVSSPGILGPIDGPPAGEAAPHAPTNAYERTKAEAERVALDFATAGLPVISARPEFIYGPGDLHVAGLFRAIQRRQFFYIAGGRFRCHPTFIDDAVSGLRLALAQGAPGQVYHIAGPRPVTFRELAETIAAALGARPPWVSLPRPIAWLSALALEGAARVTGGTPPLSRTGVDFFTTNRAFDCTRARRELGYEPQVELPDGVARTVIWCRSRGILH